MRERLNRARQRLLDTFARWPGPRNAKAITLGAACVLAAFLLVTVQQVRHDSSAPPLGAANPGPDAPRLVSKISELDFGTLGLGAASHKRFVLFHDGAGERELTVFNTWLAEPDALHFSTDFDGPATLAPGDSIVIDVRFAPTAAGSFDAPLYVSHDGASGLEIFTLSGTGAGSASDAERAAAREPAFQRRAKESFGKSLLSGIGTIKPTSLQFGPDGRLYVADMFGTIKIYEIEREGANDYEVRDTDTVTLVRDIPNHDDDGDLAPSLTNRLVTGLLVTGTASAPVIYVSSSDPRIGGGSNGKNTNLDTNSGVLSRLTTTSGGGWTRKDLVRGLPRSEENHHTNGMVLDEATNTLYIAAGGNTNLGAPSNNFVMLPEYALSAAILSIDLGAIGDATYDLPTLDDEDRPGSVDRNDPFGGNDGKNQAKLVPGGPVQVYAPGFRNAYDLVMTDDGRMYSVDNGGNAGWGGTPQGGSACTNARSEPGDTFQDGLHFIDGEGYYGGHANPTRGNQANTFNANGQSPVSVSNPIECDHRGTGANGSLVSFGTSLNGLVEYRASNFGGELQGDLLGAGFDNKIHRVVLNGAGDEAISKTTLFSNVGKIPLDVTAQADWQVFPGTIWVGDFSNKQVLVFEPADYDGSISNVCPTAPGADDDGDGYLNADELANGTDPCSAADVPPDADGDGSSDLVDDDDDNDGLDDASDPFVLDPDNGRSTPIPLAHDWENDDAPLGGLLNLGFTGLMNDGTSDWQSRFDLSNLTAGGAAGVFTIDAVPDTDPFGARNDQRYAFQFGVDVTPATAPFVVHTRLVAPLAGASRKLYQSLGFFVGTGDQDNYIKLVARASGSRGGVEFAAERDGGFERVFAGPAEVYDTDHMDLFLEVDPRAGTVRAYHRTRRAGVDGPLVAAGGATSLPTSWLTADTALAVGLISTSTQATPFTATWDFLRIGGPSLVADAKGGSDGDTGGGATGGGSGSTAGVHGADAAGRIVVEAEHHRGASATATHAWRPTGAAGAAGGKAMTTDNLGALVPGAAGSPHLGYAVDFPSAGRWRVWVRGSGDENAAGEGKSDSVHVGLDGELSSAAAMDGFPPGWHWSNDRRANVGAYIDVPSAGEHRLDLWMREDGLVVDRLLLTLDAGYVPGGIGPASTLGAPDGAGTAGGTGGTTGTGTGGDDAGGGDANDLVVVEAEASDESIPTGSHAWRRQDDADAVGGAAVRALPNVGALKRGTADSPRLGYGVNLPTAGTWYVWVRGAGDTNASGEGKNDSLHVGLNGTLAGGAAMDRFPAGGWHWSNSTRAGTRAALVATSAGAQRLDVWMREDGMTVDRLVLTRDPDWRPSGSGPSTDGSTGGGTGGTTGGADGGDTTGDSTSGGTADGDGGDTTGDTTGGSTGGGGDGTTGGTVHRAVDGVVRIDAADHAALREAGGHAWTPDGAGALRALPDQGTLRRGTASSPVAEYRVEFDRAGTWQIWVHGYGDANASNEGRNDSVHVGLDGTLAGGTAIDGFPPRWTWSRDTRGGDTATIEVGAPGEARLDVWMREDGFAFDAITLIGPGAAITRPDGADDPDGGSTGGGNGDGDTAVRVPAGATWQTVTGAGGTSVVARHEGAGVPFDGKLYVLGGRGSRAVSIFDPATGRWSAGATPPLQLHHFQPVVHGDRIWAIGAMTNSAYPRERSAESVWVYTPATDRWERGATIPAERRRGSMGAAVRGDRIYLFGGNTAGHDGGAVPWLDEFDPATGAWRVLPSARHARDHAPIAIVGDSLVAAAGRRSTQPGVFGNMVGAVEVYDFATGTWSETTAIPTRRAGTMAVAVGDEVIVIGGESEGVSQARATVEAYDTVGGGWRTLDEMNVGRHGGGAAWLSDGIHVASGNTTKGGGAETTSHEVLRFGR